MKDSQVERDQGERNQGETSKRPCDEVLSWMRDAAKGRRLGDEFEITSGASSTRVEPGALWVKAVTSSEGIQRLVLSPKPFPDSLVGHARITPRVGANPRAQAPMHQTLIRALLQSRLVAWYLHHAGLGMDVSGLPWPTIA